MTRQERIIKARDILANYLMNHNFEVHLCNVNGESIGDLYAIFKEGTMAVTAREDGCYAAVATSLTRQEMLNIIEENKENGNIGFKIFEDFMNGRLQCSNLLGICNHDHDFYEIKNAIENYEKRMEQENSTININNEER